MTQSIDIAAVDIAVIGCGIAGAGVAASLARVGAPGRKLAIMEMESQPGYHSSGRSAAIWIESYGNECIRRLNAFSRPFFDEPIGITGGTLLSKRGLLLAARSADDEETNALLEASDAVEEISAKAAEALVPVLRVNDFDRFVYESSASDIDVSRLHQGFLSSFKASGGQLITDARVKSISRTEGYWNLETDRNFSIRAKLLVNSAGAWADRVAAMAGVQQRQLIPKRRSAAIVKLANNDDVSQWPLFAEMNETWYAKPEAGSLMVSPADEDPIEACDAWVDDEVLAGGIYRFESAITDSVVSVDHQWAGLRTFAPDHTPVVGFDPDIDDFFWLAGHGGYGIQTAPALSDFAANLLSGKPVDLNLLNQMSPGRTYAATSNVVL